MAENNNFDHQVFNRNMMKTDRFFKVPKTLIYSERYQELSEGAMIVYGFYRDRFDLSEKNNWVDENGDIYFLLSDAEIAYRLGRSEVTIRNKITELIDHGLIKREKRTGAISKTYLYTVDGNARERGYLSKNRLVELLNLMFAEMTAQQTIVKSNDLKSCFIDFVLRHENDVNELEVSNLLKLHRFEVLHRIADNHILSISSKLLKKVKYLDKTTKEKSQTRTKIKKEFKISFSKCYEILSNNSQITTQEFIFQLEKLWLDQNKNIVSELDKAEKNKIQRNFVSENFKHNKLEKLDNRAKKNKIQRNFVSEKIVRKNEIQKNFVSGNKETLYADTKKLFTSQTDFSQTDTIDEDDEKNNKNTSHSEIELSQSVQKFCDNELILHESLKSITPFNMNIIKIALEKFYWRVGEKQTKQYFRHALDYTLEHIIDMSCFGTYLVQNMEFQVQQDTVLSNVKQVEDIQPSFYIPMDGPWNAIDN